MVKRQLDRISVSWNGIMWQLGAGYYSPVIRRCPEVGHLNKECFHCMNSNTTQWISTQSEEYQPLVAGRIALDTALTLDKDIGI